MDKIVETGSDEVVNGEGEYRQNLRGCPEVREIGNQNLRAVR